MRIWPHGIKTRWVCSLTGHTDPPPDSLVEWQQRRITIREQLWSLLGDLPPLFTPEVSVGSIEQFAAFRLMRIAFRNALGHRVTGYLLLPEDAEPPYPAVLYQHLHGGKYHLGKDELLQPRENTPAIGAALTGAGFAVFCIDAYAFGERQSQGPTGDREVGAATELSLFKHFLWQGQTLWGHMLHDDLLALNYLLSRPDIDPQRVAVAGMSMGGSRSTWVAALDDRPQVVVPIAQMTRYRDFAATGTYAQHSIYYYVPGILKSGVEMEHLVALVAPRHQHILIGDRDPLSPLNGINKVVDYAQRVYALYEQNTALSVTLYPGVGHVYTDAMLFDLISTLAHL